MLPLLLDHLARSDCKTGSLQTLEKTAVKNDNLLLRGHPALIALHRVKDPPRPEIMRPFPAQLQAGGGQRPLQKIPAKDVVFRNLTPEDERGCPSGLSGSPIY
jgi:hypothetical protein